MIDTATKAIVAHWKLTKAADNVPMAFDSEHQLLYVACRTPGTVIALDAATGKEVASQPAAAEPTIFSTTPRSSRVYVISGAGEVDASRWMRQELRPLELLHTAPEPRRPCSFRRRIRCMSVCRERARSLRRFASTQRPSCASSQASRATKTPAAEGRRVEVRRHRQPPWRPLAHRQDRPVESVLRGSRGRRGAFRRAISPSMALS